MNHTLLSENSILEYTQAGTPSHLDKKNSILSGVKILGFVSRNSRTYTVQALKQALELYENAKVNVNHSRESPYAPRDYQDRIGSIRNVQFREKEGLFADFYFNPCHPLAEQLLWDAEHAPENVGFSHNISARTSLQKDGTLLVEEITAVRSVDLVADPATTNGLFESFNAKEPDFRIESLSAGLDRENAASASAVDSVDLVGLADLTVEAIADLASASTVNCESVSTVNCESVSTVNCESVSRANCETASRVNCETASTSNCVPASVSVPVSAGVTIEFSQKNSVSGDFVPAAADSGDFTSANPVSEAALDVRVPAESLPGAVTHADSVLRFPDSLDSSENFSLSKPASAVSDKFVSGMENSDSESFDESSSDKMFFQKNSLLPLLQTQSLDFVQKELAALQESFSSLQEETFSLRRQFQEFLRLSVPDFVSIALPVPETGTVLEAERVKERRFGTHAEEGSGNLPLVVPVSLPVSRIPSASVPRIPLSTEDFVKKIRK